MMNKFTVLNFKFKMTYNFYFSDLQVYRLRKAFFIFLKMKIGNQKNPGTILC